MNQVGSLLLQNIECEVYCQGRLIFIPSQNHILYCLANSFFYDKFISSPGENVPGILPLPPNLPIFISSWQGRILSSDFLFCGEPAGFLLRAFGEFSFSSWFWNSMRIVSLHEWVFFYRWTRKLALYLCLLRWLLVLQDQNQSFETHRNWCTNQFCSISLAPTSL